MQTLNLLAAAGGTTVGAALTTRFARGCALARTGVGVITVTLDTQVDANECVLHVACETATQYATITNTSDQVKTITICDNAGAAAEGAFDCFVAQVASGNM